MWCGFSVKSVFLTAKTPEYVNDIQVKVGSLMCQSLRMKSITMLEAGIVNFPRDKNTSWYNVNLTMISVGLTISLVVDAQCTNKVYHWNIKLGEDHILFWSSISYHWIFNPSKYINKFNESTGRQLYFPSWLIEFRIRTYTAWIGDVFDANSARLILCSLIARLSKPEFVLA